MASPIIEIAASTSTIVTALEQVPSLRIELITNIRNAINGAFRITRALNLWNRLTPETIPFIVDISLGTSPAVLPSIREHLLDGRSVLNVIKLIRIYVKKYLDGLALIPLRTDRKTFDTCMAALVETAFWVAKDMNYFEPGYITNLIADAFLNAVIADLPRERPQSPEPATPPAPRRQRRAILAPEEERRNFPRRRLEDEFAAEGPVTPDRPIPGRVPTAPRRSRQGPAFLLERARRRRSLRSAARKSART